jgi:hypothetical protein
MVDGVLDFSDELWVPGGPPAENVLDRYSSVATTMNNDRRPVIDTTSRNHSTAPQLRLIKILWGL